MQDHHRKLSTLIEILDGYLAFAGTTKKQLPSDYQTRLLSPANPLLSELAEWVHTQQDEGSEVGSDFDNQESEFSRGVWILRDTLAAVAIEYTDGQFIGGWGTIATAVMPTCADVRFIGMLSQRLKVAQNCLAVQFTGYKPVNWWLPRFNKVKETAERTFRNSVTAAIDRGDARRPADKPIKGPVAFSVKYLDSEGVKYD